MVWDEDKYRMAVVDPKFMTDIVGKHPDLLVQFNQARFFMRDKGFGCAFTKSACKLTIHDLFIKGYKFDAGKISTPDGEQVWPTK